ncbi:rhomboid-like protein [Streptomyces geranii]|uniref:rhomboid-like protein n=1 Tax=Streptomyces geranii TaxID=2058923 RepID=UPI0018E515F1|nr:rhomboid-like protein [Streptomyces geranii]
MRFSAGPRRVWAYIRSAPGTYVWLLVLFFTTVAVHHMSAEFQEEFLRQRSTNINELSDHPVRVLISSAMWIDGWWTPYVVLYSLFHATAERWLGTLRWVVVCVVCHVVATLVSQGAVWRAIRDGSAPASAADVMDFGVSYALAGVVAVLAYRIARPWRYVYVVGVLGVYGVPLVFSRTFTDLGHFTAAVVGFCCWPLTWGRGGKVWNPKETVGASRR